jgi:hypothetical protein
MKLIIIFIILSISGTDLVAQSDSLLKFIFVPHPRSEDRTNQSVYPGILNIDFTNYDVRMLGGDITYSTSKDSATLAYCDNLFNIGSPNTLWSLGNHDVQSGNRSLIKKFTGRESFYSYGRDGVTFIVLDTELDANGFANTFIKDEQLQMVQSVCDSITESSVLILLLHRFMWMINNDYFKTMLTDSIAASSRSMDTTNFYSDIYPLLQEVKNKGIKVLVFGGDKSKINIVYSPEDSITFYAARLADDLPDSINNVIILDYNLRSKKITYNFIPLSEMIASVVQEPSQLPLGFALSQNYPNPFNPTTNIEFYIPGSGFVSLKVYDILGRKVAILVDEYMPGGNYEVEWDGSYLSGGVYFYRFQFMPDGKYTDRFTDTKKFILLK